MNRPSWFPLVLISLAALAACAHSRPANPFLEGRPPEAKLPSEVRARESRSDFAARVRRLQEQASAGRVHAPAQTVEALVPSLKLALAQVAAVPTPAAHRRAASEYERLGVVDLAADHLEAAIELDPRGAASYEQLARVWRDSGFPAVGLGDAYRGVYFAPDSAAAQNTLGTLLHRLGRRAEARARYERALAMDPAAAYALNNLCALALDEGDAARALSDCRRALSLDPGMTAAARNLDAAARLAAEQRRSHDRN